MDGELPGLATVRARRATFCVSRARERAVKVPHECRARLRGRYCPNLFSQEVPLHWNKWIRQTHRWLSMGFTVAVIINIVAIARGRYSTGVGLLAVATLALQFVTGLYLFVLPYANKWRSARSNV